MDPSNERKVKVFDFRVQIKKVRVVAWLNEKEAGGKAVQREKARLGLPPEQKLPATLKVVLFQKNLKKKMTCILCNFNSYEAARKGERLENFLHPEMETDYGVQCTRCRLFHCRICLKQLDELGLNQHPAFPHLKAYLSRPPHLASVPTCSSCSLKDNIGSKHIPMFKSTCLEQYHQEWDGMLWFPEYGLVVPSCLRTFDLHSLAQLSSKELGVLHGLVSPEMAINLENEGIKATGNKKPSAFATVTVSVMCHELNCNVKVKVKLLVYDRSNVFSDECLGSDIT